MYVLNITDEYASEKTSIQITGDENDDYNTITKVFFISIPGGVLQLSLIG